LCIDSKGNVWNTQRKGSLIHKYSSTGKHIGQFNHGYNGAQGCVVDGNDHVWVAHSQNVGATTVGHLKKNGSFMGNVTVGSGPTGVAVDNKGKVWSANYLSNSLSRIDPKKNGRIGEVDLTVNLGEDCRPYNYGDMTGSTNIAPPNSGSWTVVHDSGAPTTKWGRIEWHESVPSDSKLTVQVSSDGAKWTTVRNSDQISSTGKKLFVRVLFERKTGGKSPVLYDLSLLNNESPVAKCKDATFNATTNCKGPSRDDLIAAINDNSTDPNGGKLTFSINLRDEFPVGLGKTKVTLTATETGGLSDTCEATVTVADKTVRRENDNLPSTMVVSQLVCAPFRYIHSLFLTLTLTAVSHFQSGTFILAMLRLPALSSSRLLRQRLTAVQLQSPRRPHRFASIAIAPTW
jgi:hypothetical protein